MVYGPSRKTMTQHEAGRLLSKKVKKHFDEFDRVHRRKVAKQLRKIGINEKGNMRRRVRKNAGRVGGKQLMSKKDAENIAKDIAEDLTMSGDSGDYGALSLGTRNPVKGFDRRENLNMDEMLMEGKKRGKTPKLTAKAQQQGRTFIFFGNWNTIPYYVKKYRTLPSKGISEEIRGRSQFGGAYYFLDQSIENVDRAIVRDLPPLLKRVFLKINIEKGK